MTGARIPATEGDLDKVRALVEPHLDHIFDGGLRGLVEDTGGAGLCREASEELIARVGRGHVLYLDFEDRYSEMHGPGCGLMGRWAPLPAWASVYDPEHPDCPDSAHVVAVIDGIVVDLTARQFRADLPFPMLLGRLA